MIRVVNKRTHRGAAEYIGRPSPLGNPFVIGRDGDRDAVVAKYADWLARQAAEPGPVREALVRLWRKAKAGEDIHLCCWCAPQRCHGDEVRAFLERYL